MPSLKGSILLIEDKCIAEEFDRDLQSLIDINGFSYVKGLLIGRFSEKSKIDLDVLKDIIKSKSVLKKIPIVANVDFGHTFPQLTLPIGGEISVDCSGEKILLNVITH